MLRKAHLEDASADAGGGTALAHWAAVQTLATLPNDLARGLRARSARARVRARRRDGGFTLVELMVVVVLIAILALLAAPALRTSRDDRMVFDYARQTQQLAHRTRVRAAGTGGAQLFVAGPGAGRGVFRLFEALDNVLGPTPPGPNPVSSCKTAGQWAPVPAYVIGSISNVARFVDGLNLDTLGVNVDANVVSTFRITPPTAPNAPAATGAIAICVTGNGTTYASGGADINDAINRMLIAPPFSGIAEIRISRGGGVGLVRTIVIAGSAAPRVFSQ